MSRLREKMDRRFGAERNRTDSTKELEKEYDDYVDDYEAQDGFVSLITTGRLLALQNYLYSGMTRPLARISILLSRRGHKKLAKNLKKLINTIERFFDYFSYQKRKKRQDAARIRKSMLKNGCYVGSGDYYNNKGKPNAK